MLVAIVDGVRSTARPGIRGRCPGCGEELLARCGEILTWHWAHQADTTCPAGSWEESEWHWGWKSLAPLACCEVVRGEHRADVLASFGQGRVPLAIEFQRRWLDADQVRSREQALGRVLWIIHGQEAYDAGRLEIRGDHGFRWNNPVRWWTATTSSPQGRQSVAIDLGQGDLWSVGWTQDGAWGYGRLVSSQTLQALIQNEPTDPYELSWLTQPVVIAPRLAPEPEAELRS